jgi:MarR family transcriptional regulator for hemolysin
LEVVVPPRSINRQFAFALNEAARVLCTFADYKAEQFEITRAQWVVLARLDGSEGLKQSELAEALNLQPISVTRLVDKLCESGLIERRPDAIDRRAKRLFLAPAAQPLLEKLGELAEELMLTALAGIERESVEHMVAQLGIVKQNLRHAIQQQPAVSASLSFQRSRLLAPASCPIGPGQAQRPDAS